MSMCFKPLAEPVRRRPWRAAAALLAVGLAGCSSVSLHQQHEAAQARDAAAAQALVATAPAAGGALAPWLESERGRISAARTQAAQRFDDAEKACWQRFAVNACVRAARLERRATQESLRQQELALNELERQRRTEARLRELEQRQRPETR